MSPECATYSFIEGKFICNHFPKLSFRFAQIRIHFHEKENIFNLEIIRLLKMILELLLQINFPVLFSLFCHLCAFFTIYTLLVEALFQDVS